MEAEIRERTDAYIHARHHHPAWHLLAARRAPLILSCLQTLFEQSQDGVGFDDALRALAEMLADHANTGEFEIGEEDFAAQARKELRSWIKLSLVVEREGRVYATDAFEEALRFVTALGGRIMTSTASRLSVVQREIEGLESSLNPDPRSRTVHLRHKIAELERELAAVERGEFVVLQGAEAAERVREVYALATSLRADFRRVEDSWREADRQLRQTIVSEQTHRGEIVDKLLDGHDDLLDSSEGRVFHAFHQQLRHSIELDNMKQRLRTILRHPATQSALTRIQQVELRWLIMRLVKESAAVIQARARSERDVKGFLKTGLAAEHHRVGALLNDIFQQALNMDWGSQSLRRKAGPFPPVAIANGALPVFERLLFKSLGQDGQRDLELQRQPVSLDEVEEDFWSAFDGLDRHALLQQTLELLHKTDSPLGIGGLARHLPPTHDLETIALWLSLAREADVPVGGEQETVAVLAKEGARLRFHVPKIELTATAVASLEWEP